MQVTLLSKGEYKIDRVDSSTFTPVVFFQRLRQRAQREIANAVRTNARALFSERSSLFRGVVRSNEKSVDRAIKSRWHLLRRVLPSLCSVHL